MTSSLQYSIAIILGLVLRRLVTAVVLKIVILIYIFGFSSHLQRCPALLKSAMFYIQVMDSLISTTDIWLKLIYSAQVHISSGVNLCFSSLACFFPRFFTIFAKTIVLFSFPFVCLGMLWLAYFFKSSFPSQLNRSFQS